MGGAGADVSPDGRLPVTVIVPVRNEERNLPECLNTVAWADQVLVVDSYSEDATTEIARAAGAELVQFDYDGGWPKKKNWAMKNLPIRNEWILLLDADERVDDSLRQEIASAIQSDDVDGFYLRWKFIFLGRWMKHCWRHGWMLRLLRKGRGEYEDLGMRGEGGWDNEVHENVVVQGNTAKVQSWLIHDSKESLSDWTAKQNEFSDWNAVRRQRQMQEGIPPLRDLFFSDPLGRRKWLKALYLRLPMKPLLIFVYLYVFRLGFLDGREGYYFCALRAAHEMNIEAKYWEMLFTGNKS